MRIDRIAIDSLASLRGEQPEIVLDGGELGDAGLIAITGATGAGKSTILDAVCLALYDRTPRLASASDAQELLTRGAGAGSATVDLTLDDGRRWTVEWSVHRARQRPDGALQPSRRRVLDRTTGEIVAEGKKDVTELLEKALELSFEQFTGVILLAQGEFAKFLSAKDKERSELLEQLTGTEIYSRLGIAAFERHKELRDRLRVETEHLDRLVLLDVGERRRLEQELDELEPTLARLEAQLQGVEAQLQWLATRARLDARRGESAERLEKAETALAEAEPDRRRLRAAEQAVALAAPLDGLDAAREASERARAEHRRAEDAARRADTARERARAGLATVLDALRRALERAEVEVEAARAFATLTADQLAELRQARRDLASAATDAERRADDRASAEERAAARRAEREDADAEHDAAVERYGALAERLDELAERRRETTRGEPITRLAERRLLLARAAELHAALDEVDLDAAGEAVAAAEVERRRATADAEASRVLVETARRELDDHDAVLRMAMLGADLAEHRHHLVAGEPCPLCGALEHPLATPETGDADDRSALRRAETRRDALRRELEQAETGLREADTARRRAEQELERAEERLVRGRRAAQDHAARWIELTFQLGDLPRRPEETTAEALIESRDEAARRLEATEALDAEEAALRRDAEAAAETVTAARRRRDLAAERLDQAIRRVEEATAATRDATETAERRRAAVLDLAASLADAAGLDAPSIDSLEAFAERLADGRRRHVEAVERHRGLDTLDGRWGDRARAHLDEVARPEPEAEPTIDPPDLPKLDARLRDAVIAADAAEDAVRRDGQRLAYASEASEAAARRLADAEERLADAVAASPFDDEAGARAARLAPDAIERLRRHLDALRLDVERRRAEHDRSIADLDEHHGAAEGLGLDPDAEPEPLERELSAAAHSLRTRAGEAQERKTALRVQIEQDDAKRRQREALEATVGDLAAARDRAARLADLIGQSDGGKFRRFAQQLNLDQLLALANRRLDRLAPRYALDRLENTLDLEVVDRDMADERRPISTLSGGESFLASLALALALADLRRGQLQLGTLFLDEGFGSLDQDTLDTALSTLEQLQADQSTQILVISHVGALQERIPHRIEVRKRGGGSSRLRVRVGD